MTISEEGSVAIVENRQVGNVYLSQVICPACPCGRVVVIKKFKTFPEFEGEVRPVEKGMVGFCECGNVFIGFKPKPIEDNALSS